MPTLEERVQILENEVSNALEIKELPLRLAHEDTDFLEICTVGGESYRIEFGQLVKTFSQAVSGENGNNVITHNLNKKVVAYAIDDDNKIVSVVIEIINDNSILVAWNGYFTGKMICL